MMKHIYAANHNFFVLGVGKKNLVHTGRVNCRDYIHCKFQFEVQIKLSAVYYSLAQYNVRACPPNRSFVINIS